MLFKQISSLPLYHLYDTHCMCNCLGSCIFERIFSVSGGWLEPPEALPGLITKSIWLAHLHPPATCDDGELYLLLLF